MNRCMLWLLCMIVGAGALFPLAGFTPRAAEPRFLAVDLFVDPKGQPLAAYQLTLTAVGATIVGVEGGEHAAYSQAPYYDPAAIQHERVIIAALSTRADLPTAKTRVARVHVMTTGEGEPEFVLTMESAGTTDAEKIDAVASQAIARPLKTGEGT